MGTNGFLAADAAISPEKWEGSPHFPGWMRGSKPARSSSCLFVIFLAAVRGDNEKVFSCSFFPSFFLCAFLQLSAYLIRLFKGDCQSNGDFPLRF